MLDQLEMWRRFRPFRFVLVDSGAGTPHSPHSALLFSTFVVLSLLYCMATSRFSRTVLGPPRHEIFPGFDDSPVPLATFIDCRARRHRL